MDGQVRGPLLLSPPRGATLIFSQQWSRGWRSLAASIALRSCAVAAPCLLSNNLCACCATVLSCASRSPQLSMTWSDTAPSSAQNRRLPHRARSLIVHVCFPLFPSALRNSMPASVVNNGLRTSWKQVAFCSSVHNSLNCKSKLLQSNRIQIETGTEAPQ